MDKLYERVEELVESLVGQSCSQAILSLDYENIPCLKLFVSKGLGLGIIAGSAFLKVPQIVKILKGRSAAGISLSSYLLETITFMIGLAYNIRAENPFSTYGEGVFILVQNLIILWLLLGFQNFSKVLILGLFGGLGALSFSLLNDSLVSSDLLVTLQWGTLFLGILSKLPQILSNFQARSVGALSSTTLILQFAGTLARVFTTLQEVNDKLILLSFVLNALLNGILCLQLILFAQKKAPKTKKSLSPSKKSSKGSATSPSRRKMA